LAGGPALVSYVLDVKWDNDLRSRVGAHPFLAEMEPQHLDLLAGCVSIKQFQKDEVIFQAAEPANGFYLIENGSVALEGSVFEHGRNHNGYPDCGRTAGLVLDVPALCLAFQRAGNRANYRTFLRRRGAS
jgi:hypothetical protein